MRQWLAAVLATSGVIFGLGLSVARAQTFNSGSTGADGAFSPSVNTTLTLPASGVFNYTTVNIPSGVTVKFTRNAANTPVTILATGNVTIAGTIDVSGSNGTAFAGTALGMTAGAGGPGGFDGGNGATATVSTTGGSGRGPGGGAGGAGTTGGGGGGGFVAAGVTGSAGSGSTAGVGGAVYSDATLLPLIGGSGGGGGGTNLGNSGGGGGGGGGAILIASSGTIALNYGSILAKGGAGAAWNTGASGGGSGGAIRLIATTVSGTNGTINISGGTGASVSPSGGGAGAAGRVRVEGFTNTLAAAVTGAVAASVTTGAPTSVTLSNSPTLQITSVGGVAAPGNPGGSFFVPDVVLPGTTTNPVTVNIAASNVPLGTTLAVTVVGFMGASSSATSTALSGTLASSTATASVTIPTNEPAVISVSATFAIASLEGHGPYYADGEPVDRVRVTTHGAGRSALAFITRSGREVTVSER